MALNLPIRRRNGRFGSRHPTAPLFFCPMNRGVEVQPTGWTFGKKIAYIHVDEAQVVAAAVFAAFVPGETPVADGAYLDCGRGTGWHGRSRW